MTCCIRKNIDFSFCLSLLLFYRQRLMPPHWFPINQFILILLMPQQSLNVLMKSNASQLHAPGKINCLGMVCWITIGFFASLSSYWTLTLVIATQNELNKSLRNIMCCRIAAVHKVRTNTDKQCLLFATTNKTGIDGIAVTLETRGGGTNRFGTRPVLIKHSYWCAFPRFSKSNWKCLACSMSALY